MPKVSGWMPHIVWQDIDEDTIMVRIGKQSLQRPELAELVEQAPRLAGRGCPEQLDHNMAAMASLVVHQRQRLENVFTRKLENEDGVKSA
jgi:hypothetical protein